MELETFERNNSGLFMQTSSDEDVAMTSLNYNTAN